MALPKGYYHIKSNKGRLLTKRGGKIQFLFWTFFFSILLYLWIIYIAINTFIIDSSIKMSFPKEEVRLLFLLYGLLALLALSGTVISIFISNRGYTTKFGALVMVLFGTIIAAKGIFG